MFEKNNIITEKELQDLKNSLSYEAKLAYKNHKKKYPKSSRDFVFIKEIKFKKCFLDQIYSFLKYKTNFVFNIQRGVKHYDTFCILVM